LKESGAFGEDDIDIDANIWTEDGNEIPVSVQDDDEEEEDHEDRIITNIKEESDDDSIQYLPPITKQAPSLSKTTANVKAKADPYESALSIKCSWNNIIQLLEQLLSFHSFYKFGTVFNCSKEQYREDILVGVCRMLMLVRMSLPRKKGNGWESQKFCEMLHMARDLYRFGFSGNYDAGPGKLSLRFFAKKMSASAQKRGYTKFISQTANCLYKFTLMAKVCPQMNSHGKLDGTHVQILNAVAKDEVSGLT
jgi:hypothetical protein